MENSVLQRRIPVTKMATFFNNWLMDRTSHSIFPEVEFKSMRVPAGGYLRILFMPENVFQETGDCRFMSKRCQRDQIRGCKQLDYSKWILLFRSCSNVLLHLLESSLLTKNISLSVLCANILNRHSFISQLCISAISRWKCERTFALYLAFWIPPERRMNNTVQYLFQQ